MQKWEYMVSGWKQVVTDSGVERSQIIRYLNEAGDDGWDCLPLPEGSKADVLYQAFETACG